MTATNMCSNFGSIWCSPPLLKNQSLWRNWGGVPYPWLPSPNSLMKTMLSSQHMGVYIREGGGEGRKVRCNNFLRQFCGYDFGAPKILHTCELDFSKDRSLCVLSFDTKKSCIDTTIPKLQVAKVRYFKIRGALLMSGKIKPSIRKHIGWLHFGVYIRTIAGICVRMWWRKEKWWSGTLPPCLCNSYKRLCWLTLC